MRYLDAIWTKIWTEKLFRALLIGYLVLLILLLSGIVIQSFLPDIGSKIIGSANPSPVQPVTITYSGLPPAT